MQGLASVCVALPMDVIETWSSYFWYATGASPARLPIYERLRKPGEWVEQSAPLYRIGGTSAHICSPVSGEIVTLSDFRAELRPAARFNLPENAGAIMFSEVVALGHEIEAEIAKYVKKGPLARAFARPRFHVEDLVAKRSSSQGASVSLESLMKETCSLVER